MEIGTEAYDKWLSEYRANITRQCENTEILGLSKRARHDYTLELCRIRQINIESMVVRHKTIYYERLEAKKQLQKWKAFEETSKLNEDIKRLIKSYL